MVQTKDSKIEQLKKKKEQLDKRIRKMEVLEKQRERKKDTRRKILVGSFYLDQIKQDTAMDELVKKLDSYLTRNSDRVLFDLPPLEEKSSSTESSK